MRDRDPKTSAAGALSSQNLAGRPGRIAAREVNRLEEDTFHTMLALERRRAERSRKPFVLMLLDATALFQNGHASRLLEQLTSAVLADTRETDVIGWYKKGAVLGVIFTEVSLPEKQSITQVLLGKVVKALHNRVDHPYASKIVITAHLFPENLDREGTGVAADVSLYPDLARHGRKRAPLIAKRAIDMVGSGILLVLLSPVLAASPSPSNS